MTYRDLPLAALLVLACSPKTDLTESASDTVSSTTTSGDGSSSSPGHSQTSNSPELTTTGGGGQTVTSASSSEPGTVSATTTSATDPDDSATATDGSASDTTIGSTSGTSSTTATTITTSTTGGVCNDPPKQPLDAQCTDPDGCGCLSGHCFVIPAIGGSCSECTSDNHCPDGGCTVPNPLDGTGARCNAGGPGDGCHSDSACNDPGAPHCVVVLEVPGIITAATCSACATNADCPAQAPNCSPDYDVSGFTGQHSCKADASVPNNSGCELTEVMGAPLGDQACASGMCGEASVMGLIKLGVCGECETDSDCGPGQNCSEPAADLEAGTLVGATCL